MMKTGNTGNQPRRARLGCASVFPRGKEEPIRLYHEDQSRRKAGTPLTPRCRGVVRRLASCLTVSTVFSLGKTVASPLAAAITLLKQGVSENRAFPHRWGYESSSAASFPLTLGPSPLGRGKSIWRCGLHPTTCAITRRLAAPVAGERGSLSPRERDGVRGNSAAENSCARHLTRTPSSFFLP